MRVRSQMFRVYFLIRSLERGGAERQLIELARGLAEQGHEVIVGTLYPGGALRKELEGLPQLTLRSFGKTWRWDPLFLLRLAKDVWFARPDVVHGYMSPANELAVLLAKFAGTKSVVGLRASDMELARYGRVAKQLFRAGAWASRFADAVVVNSHAGQQHHAQHGYSISRMLVIPNGVDCERFKFDAEQRRALRTLWGISEQELLFGLVGRVDPMKDHATFLRAVALMEARSDVRFVCVGGGSEGMTAAMQQLSKQLGIDSRVRWTGARDDMPSVYSALDVLVLSSAFGEGFPNVVAEAMATERPCVVTDVGDAALVVGETGMVVPPRAPEALAVAMDTLARSSPDERRQRGIGARDRVVAHFSNRRLVESTSALLDELVRGAPGLRAAAASAASTPAKSCIRRTTGSGTPGAQERPLDA